MEPLRIKERTQKSPHKAGLDVGAGVA